MVSYGPFYFYSNRVFIMMLMWLSWFCSLNVIIPFPQLLELFLVCHSGREGCTYTWLWCFPRILHQVLVHQSLFSSSHRIYTCAYWITAVLEHMVIREHFWLIGLRACAHTHTHTHTIFFFLVGGPLWCWLHLIPLFVFFALPQYSTNGNVYIAGVKDSRFIRIVFGTYRTVWTWTCDW